MQVTPRSVEPPGVAKLAAGAVLVLASLVFVGWLLGIDALKGPVPGLVQMKANTALGLIAMGTGVFLLINPTPRRCVAARALACFAVAIGLAVVYQYALDLNLGIDELLFSDPQPVDTVHPGRLAPQTAVAFVFMGTALILLSLDQVRAWLVDLLAGLALIVSLFAVLGYVYGAASLERLPSFTPMALHTAVACLLLAGALAALNRDGFFAQSLSFTGSGSVAARRLLPVVLLLFPLAGWLHVEGERLGWYTSGTGAALMAVGSVVVLTLAILFLVRAINRIDAARERSVAAEHRLASLVEVAEEAIFSTDHLGIIATWNGAAERLYGYAAEEIIGQPVDVLRPPELGLEGSDPVQDLLAGGGPAYETRRLHRDGSIVDVALSAAPIVETGALVGVCASTHGIGDQLRAKQLLEQRVRERTADLARSREETLERLALAAEFRDDDTARHTERVGEAAASVAQALGLPLDFVKLLRQAVPLHDVGKIGISDAILLKPGKLTPEEYEAMKQHTALGAQLLSGSESRILQLAEEVALTHHERWDGHGYPAGLAGEEIPIAGRIAAVVDSFDAMVHDRPYRRGMLPAEALAEIERCIGSQFDPEVGAAFLALKARELPRFASRVDA